MNRLYRILFFLAACFFSGFMAVGFIDKDWPLFGVNLVSLCACVWGVVDRTMKIQKGK